MALGSRYIAGSSTFDVKEQDQGFIGSFSLVLSVWWPKNIQQSK
jgi:hypothetical protein